jgi:drug/metabolite transporter (DMT)-like permease
MSDNKSYYLQLHLIIVISSLIPSINRLIHLNSLEIVFYRTLIATIIFGGYVWIKKLNIRLEQRLIAELLIVGLITAVYWTLHALAAKIANSSVTLVGVATSPLWVSVIHPIITNKRMDYYQILTGVCAVFGVYMIFGSGFEYGLGLLIAIIAAFFGALVTVLNAQFAKSQNLYVVSFFQMSGAWVGSMLLFPFFNYINSTSLQTPTYTDIVLIVFIAFTASIYGYSVLIKVMRLISPFTVVLVSNLAPVYGMIAALIIHGKSEMMNMYFYAGTCVILFSVIAYPLMEMAAKQRIEREQNKMA